MVARSWVRINQFIRKGFFVLLPAPIPIVPIPRSNAHQIIPGSLLTSCDDMQSNSRFGFGGQFQMPILMSGNFACLLQVSKQI
jgi:hypothetical protein